MAEKSSKTILYCNLTILFLEFTVLIWIMALVKLDGNFSEQSSESNGMTNDKNFHPRLRRSTRSASTRPRSSRTCQKIQEYYDSRCSSSRSPSVLEETTRLTNTQEQSFVQDLLTYFNTYSRNLKRSTSPSEPQRAPQPVNDPPTESNMEEFSQNTEIGVARLWQENANSTEKCRREGLEGSLACRFEYDYPDQALKLFKLLQPVLITESNNETLSRSSRSSDDYSTLLNQNLIEPTSENEEIERSEGNVDPSASSSNSSRRKRNIATNMDSEVCSTVFVTRSLAHACHAVTGNSVSLYMFRGGNRTRDLHMQLYELGSCVSAVPIGVATNTTLRPTCRNATSKILAYFLISRLEGETGRYKRCFNIIDTPYSVCRDWILVQSYCKLFYDNSDQSAS